jgi:anti-sigma regulatory factor (Ser/Thr protein kinase)
LRIELPARPENVAVIREEAVSHAGRLGMAPERLGDLKTVVSEACGNVVRYAYEEDERDAGTVEVVIALAGEELEVRVSDEGRGICPRPESVLPGMGLGLPLIGALSSRLVIDSRLGSGTEMRISIPIRA